MLISLSEQFGNAILFTCRRLLTDSTGGSGFSGARREMSSMKFVGILIDLFFRIV